MAIAGSLQSELGCPGDWQPECAATELTAGADGVWRGNDHGTHWVTDNVGSISASAPGSYQAAIGCPGDWQPECLRSWLQDPDGDGVYRISTTAIPAGGYEFKVALNESWDVNYGQGGAPGRDNVAFTSRRVGPPWPSPGTPTPSRAVPRRGRHQRRARRGR